MNETADYSQLRSANNKERDHDFVSVPQSYHHFHNHIPTSRLHHLNIDALQLPPRPA